MPKRELGVTMPTRMFKSVTRTWNPYTGCLHDCTYCWARDLALGRLKHTKAYAQGFAPTFHPPQLLKQFKPGEFIFVSSMGDLFGGWVPREWIMSVLTVIHNFPKTDFLLQTKNPSRFSEFELPPNVYAGATIESNIDHAVSKATSPFNRYQSMVLLPHIIRKFVSIEPIMDFDLDIFSWWIEKIRPNIIEIGADNHHKNLIEPPGNKVKMLINRLREKGLNVIEKPGLERVKGGT